MKRRDNNEFNGLAPYNHCDYRCEDCDKKDICIVYKKELERSLKHLMNGENPADIKVIFEDLQEDFSKISESLYSEMMKHGIPVEEDVFSDQEVDEDDFEDNYIREHPLYQSVQKLYEQIHHFLENFFQKPVQGDSANQFFQDLAWYHTILLAKVYRLLSDHTIIDNEQLDEIVYEESILTLEVIKKSILIVKNALEKLVKSKKEAEEDIQQIKADLEDFESELDNLDFDIER